jgi:hypothetical protein
MTTGQHEYTSTARLHGQCGSCRKTCKYCDASCQHGCHTQAGGRPVAGVDQARGIARELLATWQQDRELSDEFCVRLDSDPDLFWLRGEEAPPGTWRADG